MMNKLILSAEHMFVRLVSFEILHICTILTYIYLRSSQCHTQHRDKLHTSLGGLHMPPGLLHQMGITQDIGLRGVKTGLSNDGNQSSMVKGNHYHRPSGGIC